MLCAVGACKDKSKASGLPPAKEWSANAGGDMPPAQAPPGSDTANPHGDMQNPHGDMQENPHGDMQQNPHGDTQNPHGAGGPDVGAMGLPAPDPNRKIDPKNHVKGVIKVHPKAKSRLAAGGAVFITIKKVGPDGAAAGPPLAVDKLTWQKDELPFELGEKNAMIAGTELKGDVVVTARYDQDGDALSKQPGDVVGTLRVKIPAEKVVVMLDEVLP